MPAFYRRRDALIVSFRRVHGMWGNEVLVRHGQLLSACECSAYMHVEEMQRVLVRETAWLVGGYLLHALGSQTTTDTNFGTGIKK